ncbi:unnamed protein product [Allacma fusca]|uniref:Uncharacterized protein n=1 Tax=Allacma fusca TaxID=39272 RepID=A0A8J2K6Y3_9HEXA|nr:unnamed protein product [Allacma fusca]
MIPRLKLKPQAAAFLFRKQMSRTYLPRNFNMRVLSHTTCLFFVSLFVVQPQPELLCKWKVTLDGLIPTECCPGRF